MSSKFYHMIVGPVILAAASLFSDIGVLCDYGIQGMYSNYVFIVLLVMLGLLYLFNFGIAYTYLQNIILNNRDQDFWYSLGSAIVPEVIIYAHETGNVSLPGFCCLAILFTQLFHDIGRIVIHSIALQNIDSVNIPITSGIDRVAAHSVSIGLSIVSLSFRGFRTWIIGFRNYCRSYSVIAQNVVGTDKFRIQLGMDDSLELLYNISYFVVTILQICLNTLIIVTVVIFFDSLSSDPQVVVIVFMCLTLLYRLIFVSSCVTAFPEDIQNVDTPVGLLMLFSLLFYPFSFGWLFKLKESRYIQLCELCFWYAPSVYILNEIIASHSMYPNSTNPTLDTFIFTSIMFGYYCIIVYCQFFIPDPLPHRKVPLSVPRKWLFFFDSFFRFAVLVMNILHCILDQYPSEKIKWFVGLMIVPFLARLIMFRIWFPVACIRNKCVPFFVILSLFIGPMLFEPWIDRGDDTIILRNTIDGIFFWTISIVFLGDFAVNSTIDGLGIASWVFLGFSVFVVLLNSCSICFLHRKPKSPIVSASNEK